MDESLTPPLFPISISDGFINKAETILTMHCHDRVFKSVTVLGEAGETLYTITRKGAGSLTWRRSITDSSDIHLFDLRHFGYAMKNKWAVETPGRREIATLHHVNGRDEKSSGNQNRSDLDMTAKNRFDKEEEGEGEGEEVRLEMRQVDRSGITTLVYVGDEMVAEIRVVEENDVVDLRGRDRSVWKARVAGGVDLAVIVFAMLCRAEMNHVWRQ